MADVTVTSTTSSVVGTVNYMAPEQLQDVASITNSDSNGENGGGDHGSTNINDKKDTNRAVASKHPVTTTAGGGAGGGGSAATALSDI